MNYPPQNIVLDLDETLIHCWLTNLSDNALHNISNLGERVYTMEMRDIFTPVGTGVAETVYAIERPHLHTFLKYCYSRFQRVVIWSAARKEYVNANVAHLTKRSGPPDLVWSFDECDTHFDGVLTKPLSKLCAVDPKTFTIENTWTVDDRSNAFTREGTRGNVVVPLFAPDAGTKHCEQDIVLLELMRFFDQPEVRGSTNVQEAPLFEMPPMITKNGNTVVD